MLNHAWGAVEAQDLPIASDYAQRAIASAVRHELPGLEANARAQLARVLELRGRWTEASDVAHDLLGAGAIPQMVALPILAVIEARRGRMAARDAVERGWRMALVADEVQRLAPAAAAAAEFAWIHGDVVVAIADIQRVMHAALDLGFVWSPGRLAFWLWQLGALASPPSGIAEPYRLAIEGRVTEAAAMWSARRIPYEQALVLTRGSQAERFEAIDMFEGLGATAVAAKARKALRDSGVVVPRGKGRETRQNEAGLTARQAEILRLLDGGLTNTQIADRLFLSRRTVENHVAAVLDKLDVTTRDEAVARARAEGLLGADLQT